MLWLLHGSSMLCKLTITFELLILSRSLIPYMSFWFLCSYNLYHSKVPSLVTVLAVTSVYFRTIRGWNSPQIFICPLKCWAMYVIKYSYKILPSKLASSPRFHSPRIYTGSHMHHRIVAIVFMVLILSFTSTTVY